MRSPFAPGVLTISLAAVLTLASSGAAQTCASGQLLRNDNLPRVPAGATTVSVVPGLCEGEACAAVFDVSSVAAVVQVHSAAVGYFNAGGAAGTQASVDLEIFDGISWAGGIPTLGPRVFQWSQATGSSLAVSSSGINETPSLTGHGIIASSGTLVVAWRMDLNPLGGSCAAGYTTNFATDNTCTGFFCPCTVGTRKNLIFIQGQGWRDAATASVSGVSLCPLFLNGNWIIRACVSAAACPQPLPIGSGTPGAGGIVPTLTTSGGLPRIGSPGFGLAIGSALGVTPGLVLLGSTQTSLPFAGGAIYTVPLATIPVTLGGAPGQPGAGFAIVPLPIPNNPALVGGGLVSQAALLDPAATMLLALTGGLRFVICP